MFGKRKSKKSDPMDPVKVEAADKADAKPSVTSAGVKPAIAKDRVERGLEADDTRPLYAAASIHPTSEHRFSFDSDGPVGGPVRDIRSPIDESDEELRRRRGALDQDTD